MDLFRSKAPACEVIIRILTGNDKEFSTKLRHIVLPVTTHTTINHLKSKLHGVTKVPVDRILLLFCGRTVGPGHLRIPAEAFEYTTALDEDVIKFKPHLCMCILSEPDKGEKEKGPNDSCDERNSTPAAKEGSYFEDHSDQKKLAHQQGAKRHRNPYGSFDIEQELAKIKLEKFAPVLISAGYGNEGSFSFLSEETLRAPGLWIPARAAQQITQLAVSVRLRLEKNDAGHTTLRREVEQEMLEAQRLKPVAMEGAGPGGQAKQFTKKADLRREWQQTMLQNALDQKNRKIFHDGSTSGDTAVASGTQTEYVATSNIGGDHKTSVPPKQIDKALQLRMETIKRRCADVAVAAEAEFEGITDLLHKASSGFPRSKVLLFSANRNGKKDQRSGTNSSHRLRLRQVAISEDDVADGHGRSTTSAAEAPSEEAALLSESADSDVLASPRRRLRVVGAKSGSRSKASSTSRRHTSNSSTEADSEVEPEPEGDQSPTLERRAPAAACLCCAAHADMLLHGREHYLAWQRVVNALELRVWLERISSFSRGFVRSQTLLALVERKMRGYFRLPARTADASTHALAVRSGLLSLAEQRELILWIQRKEAATENFASVLPATLYNPQKFIAHFVDLLEQFDRERIS